MKPRYILPAAFLAFAGASAAQAACYHNGVAYGPGAKRCYSGFLEECTVASYWKAIGQCRKDSALKEGQVSGKPTVDPTKAKPQKSK
jgi:hypothetical protein